MISFRRLRGFASAVLLASSLALAAGADAKRTFTVPAGTAEVSLKLFSVFSPLGNGSAVEPSLRNWP